MQKLLEFLENSYTAYNACEYIRKRLVENGFTRLKEQDEWEISENGKYFIERGGSSIIAFVIGDLDNFSYKITASHLDSPALKIKANPVEQKGVVTTLNTETYGGGIWYSFFDRPLKIAGTVALRKLHHSQLKMLLKLVWQMLLNLVFKKWLFLLRVQVLHVNLQLERLEQQDCKLQ